MKRVFGFLLTLTLLCSCVGTISVSAAEESAFGWDFSAANAAENWKNMNRDPKPAPSQEVTRIGREYAIKWAEHTKDGSTPWNSRFMSPNFENLGKVLACDYLNFWIYSEKANGQEINVIVQDATSGQYVQNVLTVDWSGWKLCQLNISGYTLSSFTKDKQAQESDEMYLNLQTSGWGKMPLVDTLLYIDSIWFSKENPLEFPKTEQMITPSIRDNLCDVMPGERVFCYTADREFKLGKDAYSGAVSVSRNDIPLTEGTDYKVQQEANKLYVALSEPMTEGSEYTVALGSGTTMQDGTAIPAQRSAFTVNTPELSLGEYVFSAGGTITAPPSSGKVEVRVDAFNRAASAQQVTMLVGVYDKTTNAMKALGVGTPVSIAPGATEQVTAQVTADSYANCYIRAFVWNSESGMYPFGTCGEIISE